MINDRKFADSKGLYFECEDCGDSLSGTVEVDRDGDVFFKIEKCGSCIESLEKEKDEEIKELEDKVEELEDKIEEGDK